MIVVDTPLLRLYQGHVLEELRAMPDESVDCVVTSPPYWGLRAYSTEPVIWPNPDCAPCDQELRPQEHVWGRPTKGRVSGGGDRPPDHKASHGLGSVDSQQLRHTCERCGAWRGELGLEPTPEMYVQHIVEIFREVRRVLRRRGTLWLNLGDTYAARPSQGNSRGEDSMMVDRAKQIPRGTGRWGMGQRWAPGVKPKDLVGIPWRVAFALQQDGWYLRSDIVWSKPNPMPESVVDRPTRSHEYVFLLAKSRRYYYDAVAIQEPLVESSIKRLLQPTFDQQHGGPKDYGPDSNRSARKAIENLRDKTLQSPHLGGRRQAPEPGEEGWASLDGRNARSVWTIPTQPYPEAHFATFPEELPRRCILAGTPERVCTTCGKPSERVVVAAGGTIGKSWHNHEDDLARGQRGGDQHNIAAAAWAKRDRPTDPQSYRQGRPPGWREEAAVDPYRREAAGWTDCGHGTYAPGVVLDPFAGSGTTLAVANALGRRAVGIELQPEYVDLIRGRCEALTMAAWNAGEPIRTKEDRPTTPDYAKAHATLL